MDPNKLLNDVETTMGGFILDKLIKGYTVIYPMCSLDDIQHIASYTMQLITGKVDSDTEDNTVFEAIVDALHKKYFIPEQICVVNYRNISAMVESVDVEAAEEVKSTINKITMHVETKLVK